MSPALKNGYSLSLFSRLKFFLLEHSGYFSNEPEFRRRNPPHPTKALFAGKYTPLLIFEPTKSTPSIKKKINHPPFTEKPLAGPHLADFTFRGDVYSSQPAYDESNRI
jgi:hypothetical protein